MPLECEVLPRPDATADELKALGTALRAWFEGFVAGLRAAGRDADGWIDRDALNDLLAGEPHPLALRFASLDLPPTEARDALDRARAASPRVRRSIPEGKSRSVLFGFWLDEADRGRLLAGLRAAVPVKSVADVRVNGQNWGEGE